jgi:arylsulfatase A-like enzyme
MDKDKTSPYQFSTKRRDALKTIGFGTSALALFSLLPSACRTKTRKPNILFLFTDDQRFDTLGALNNPAVRTPNMDRLVKAGTSFTRAHIMGGTSGAVCMPSRAMLMTGRTLFHLENKGASIPAEHIMLPELLRKTGYITFGTGKWHNGREAYARCFSDGGKIMFGGMSDHLKVPVYDFDPEGIYPEKKRYEAGTFSSELFSDEAVRFLRNREDDRPFFCYVSYTAPHDPRMAPEPYARLYPPKKIDIPPNFMPKHPFDNGEMFIRDENLAPFPRTPEIVREHIAAYYAMITHLDAQIGRVLDALEDSGEAENTLIVFAGDNGLAVGQHGLLGKQNLYDHSVRVPLVFCGPGIPANETQESLCYLLDIYPTLCDMTGLEMPASIEGRSLRPVIKSGTIKIRDSVFLAYTKIQRGIRTDDDWKLICYNNRGMLRTQLFNLRVDPWEKIDLAGLEAHRERQQNLTERLKREMIALDDFCDLDKPNWGLPIDDSIVR